MEIFSTSIPWFCPWYTVGLFSVSSYPDPLNFIPGYKNSRYTFMDNWKYRKYKVKEFKSPVKLPIGINTGLCASLYISFQTLYIYILYII